MDENARRFLAIDPKFNCDPSRKNSKVICFYSLIFQTIEQKIIFFLFLCFFQDDFTKGKGSISHREHEFYLLNSKDQTYKFYVLNRI